MAPDWYPSLVKGFSLQRLNVLQTLFLPVYDQSALQERWFCLPLHVKLILTKHDAVTTIDFVCPRNDLSLGSLFSINSLSLSSFSILQLVLTDYLHLAFHKCVTCTINDENHKGPSIKDVRKEGGKECVSKADVGEGNADVRKILGIFHKIRYKS